MEINQIAPQQNTVGSPLTDNKAPVADIKQAAQAKQAAAQKEAEVAREKEIESKYGIAGNIKAMDMKEMAKELQGLADSLGRSVKFSVNQESGDEVIMVFHKKTKELIRQIPSEEVVELRERLSKVFGSLIEERI